MGKRNKFGFDMFTKLQPKNLWSHRTVHLAIMFNVMEKLRSQHCKSFFRPLSLALQKRCFVHVRYRPLSACAFRSTWALWISASELLFIKRLWGQNKLLISLSERKQHPVHFMPNIVQYVLKYKDLSKMYSQVYFNSVSKSLCNFLYPCVCNS